MYDQYAWRSKLRKCPIGENDLKEMGILEHKDIQRKNLYLNSERNNCIMMQGAGFVFKERVVLTLGIGAINVLEAFSQFNDVEGVVGTGNVLFMSDDCKEAYSALNEEESRNRYEVNKTGRALKYALGAKLAPLIIINRVFAKHDEFIATKARKSKEISFDLGNTFFTEPIKYSGSIKARLRSKFIKTVQTVHCVHHPTLMEKELFFDDFESIKNVINKFNGYFILGYTYFSTTFAESIGMKANFELDIKDNSSEIVSYTILKLVEQFYKKNKQVWEST